MISEQELRYREYLRQQDKLTHPTVETTESYLAKGGIIKEYVKGKGLRPLVEPLKIFNPYLRTPKQTK